MEIKVRAWDKKEKKMIENVGVFYSDNTAYIYKYTSPALGYVEVFVNAKYQDRFIPMLYTNCKDIKGKEIYEGDIVSSAYDKLIVAFGNGSFYLKSPSTNSYMDLSSEIINWYGLKVIGNVWEHPNLLWGGKNATK